MHKTEKTVIVLKAIATVASLSIILWSLGLPSLRFADAANITDVSDILSDSAPSAVSNHTISFVTPSGVANGDTVTINMPSGFDISTVLFTDVDYTSTSSLTVAADCSGSEQVAFSKSGQDLIFNFCSGKGGSLSAGATSTITIGTNATSGVHQIINPAAEGSYELGFTVGTSDSGWTRVVILSGVTVSATIPTIFTFSVAGVTSGGTVNGVPITGSSASTSIPFGTLSAGVATTAAQMLSVTTNASNGYSVTVQIDQPLQSSTGADIDGFNNGSDTNTPATWVAPSNTLGSENTYGHWGITSDDATTTRVSQFASAQFIAASTSPRIVMSNNGPSNGTGMGVGTTTVGYKVEIGSLQEAGDDYTTTLTYVASPTF